MTALPIALGIGAAGSLLGGLLGGNAASKQAAAELQAGRENRQWTQDTADEYNLRRYSLLAPEMIDSFLASLPAARRDALIGRGAKDGTITPDQQRRLEELNGQISRAQATGTTRNTRGRPNPELDRLTSERDAIMSLTRGDPGVAGRIDLNALRAASGSGLLSQFDTIAGDYKKSARGVLGSYDAGTQGLLASQLENENLAKMYGAGEEKRIRQDAADRLKEANRLLTSNLLSRGLGSSSTLANGLAQNVEQSGRGVDASLADLNNRKIGLMTGLGSQRTNLLASRYGGRTPLLSDANQQATNLRIGGLNARIGLLDDPLVGHVASSRLPGVSSSAAGQSVFANALTGASSPLMGAGLYGLLNGGGGGGSALSNNPYGIQGPIDLRR